MKMEKVSPWIALATNIGVLIGIVLLVFEISQNTDALEIQAEGLNVTQWSNISQFIAGSPDLTDIIVRGNEDIESLSVAEQMRYQHYVLSTLTVAQATFRSIERNQFDYDVSIIVIVIGLLENPGARTIYEVTKSYYTTDFVERIDQALSEL